MSQSYLAAFFEIAVLVSVLISAALSQAQTPDTNISEIGKTKERILNHHYNDQRRLWHYYNNFSDLTGLTISADYNFMLSLFSLKENQRWLDVGPGAGYAIYDFIKEK